MSDPALHGPCHPTRQAWRGKAWHLGPEQQRLAQGGLQAQLPALTAQLWTAAAGQRGRADAEPNATTDDSSTADGGHEAELGTSTALSFGVCVSAEDVP